jgi:hypothetical protein
MRALRTVGVAACGLWLCTLPALADDLTITSKVVASKGQPATSTVYMTAGKMRTTGANADVIMDVASGKLVVIDNAKKQYWEATREEMNAAMQTASDAMTRASEQMKQNPQAAKMMEGLMGNMAGQVSVQKGTGSRKIAGYTCDEYVLSMGTMMKQQMWVTTELVPPMSIAQYATAQKALFAGSPLGSSMTKAMDEMSKVKGFPLATTTTISMLGQNQETSSEAIEIKKGPVPESVFTIPQGYSKTDSPFVKMQQRHH